MVHRSCRRRQRGEQSLPQWNVRRSRRCRGEIRTLHHHETEDDKPSSHDLSPCWQPFLAHTDAADNHGGPIVVIPIIDVSVIGVNADETLFSSNACGN